MFFANLLKQSLSRLALTGSVVAVVVLLHPFGAQFPLVCCSRPSVLLAQALSGCP